MTANEEQQPRAEAWELQAEVQQLRAEVQQRRQIEEQLRQENAALRVKLDELTAEILKLTTQVGELTAKLSKDSSNSSKPPSSDPPWRNKRTRGPRKGGRKAGGQPGHKPNNRQMLEPTREEDCRPANCSGCGAELDDSTVVPGMTHVHQTVNFRILREVTNFHMEQCKCLHCGEKTRAHVGMGTGVPASNFGPNVHATALMLIGEYHVSREEAARFFKDQCGIHISVGALQSMVDRAAAALRPASEGILRAIIESNAKHCDETGWRQNNERAWLWVAANDLGAYFHIDPERSRAAFSRLLPEIKGLIHTDRYSAYIHLHAKRHQFCHAHLRRDNQSLIDLGGSVGKLGEALQAASNDMFSLWHRYVDDKIDRDELITTMEPIKDRVRALAEQATGHEHRKVKAMGKSLLKHWDSLWCFVEVEGGKPTNNLAERALRPAVIKRRKNGGTRSELGAEFLSRMMTVVATAKRNGINLPQWLASVFEKWWDSASLPLLLPASTA